MRRAIYLILVFFVAAGVWAGAAPKKFKKVVMKPADQSSKDASLKKYMDNLKKIVKSKDLKGLKAASSPEFAYCFDSDGGFNLMVENWNLKSDPKNVKFWKLMEFLVNNGGTYQDGGYSVPYWYGSLQYPDDSEGETVYYILAGQNVNIRKEPSSKSAVVAKLSYETVLYLESSDVTENIGGEEYPWIKVRLSDGKEGYVFEKYLYGMYSFRAVFEKVDGQWKMSAMAAGD
ncbi:MAG: hypothetical protein A2014_00865 [Spirochaetes bacterium GWF1_49_6]|nr:MAG: hypothetical protein A2014_00865 [Spirochaetes bacterium GWF1_49_6]